MPDANGGQLNVVLHGLMAVVVWDDTIEILMPQMSDHTFIAGTWRSERRLREGATYQLRGAKRETTLPNALFAKNPSLKKFPTVDRSRDRLYCNIYLPYPKAIAQARLAKRGGSLSFEGANSADVTAQEFAMVSVLSYDYADATKLSFGPNFEWTPVVKDNGDINLHIFSEEAFPSFLNVQHAGSLNHLEHAFSQMVALFPAMDLDLAGTGEVVTGGTFITTMDGLPEFEQKALHERDAKAELEDDFNLSVAAAPANPGNCFPMNVDNRGGG